jgi:two-component sensor histidine kinase
MKWISALMIFFLNPLAEAQIFIENGTLEYRQVFVQTDDFGTEYLDVLSSSLEKIQNDTMRLMVMNDLGYYYHTRNLKKSIDIINQGLVEASKVNNRLWEGMLQVSQGAVLLRLEELDKAESVLRSALEKLPEQETWLLYTNLGYVYERRGDLGIAFEMATKTLQLGEKYDNKKAIAMAFSDMSNLFWKQGKFQIGYDYGLESLKLFDAIGIIDLDQNFTLYVTGNNLVALKRYEEALSYFQKSIESGERYGFYNNLSDNFIALTELYIQTGEFEKGVKSGLEALKYAELLENDFMVMRSLLVLGEINNRTGNFKKAIEYLEKSLSVATADFGDKYFLSLAYLELSKAYEGNRQLSKALKTARSYDSLKQSVFTAEADERISLIQTQLNVNQKENTIKLQEAKLRQQRILQIFFLTLTGTMVAFLFILYGVFKKKRKYSQQLESQNLEKEFLLKEIHHRVKNNLETISSLLTLQTARIENKEFQDIMEETQNRVHSMGMIHQKLYQGKNLKSIEMKDFFINLASYIIDTYDATDKVKLDCPMNKIELDVDRAIPIGLIVNELLSNSLKYAFPNGRQGIISISLTESKEQLFLKVSDNGVGMNTPPTIQGTGFGTQLITLLTRQLDGKMTLLTQKGTEIFFEFETHKAA